MAESKEIYKAIAAIQASLGNIPKNGKGPASQGAYAYVSNDDIIQAVRNGLIEHGVIVQANTLHHDASTREIAPNRFVAVTEVLVEFQYVSVKDGSSITVQVVGEGADNGDKGFRKAFTQAQKVANLLTFNIATGEPDPDGIEVQAQSGGSAVAAKTSAAAAGEDPAAIFKQISTFLSANKVSGSVANALGKRHSGGKSNAEWERDTKVLKAILKSLQDGERE
jgi:hypothetical protein